MRIFENCHLFHYPFEKVSAAHWQKYPNEYATHVVAVDTLDRKVLPDTQTLYTERLITCRQGVPRWILKLVDGAQECYVREVSYMDLKSRTLTLYSSNMTFCDRLRVHETVTYSPHYELNATVFRQEARIEALAYMKRLANIVEQWSVDRISQKASIGKLGFENVLKQINLSVFHQLPVPSSDANS
ncbi:intermembrane space protein sorting protein [Schizosaccharomyces octosporus yFS286]|uniref:Intermembrane space protein sorting protein n=1 Tax=Schizosaccharomyces octosporus (strain yFS286) TaxID=483514 RepID=S9Q3X9_SCHOY|nr:intermembrane space protein sorting protein [Schizosaccharomyces octosporus yFS286]EPX74368.1 intermembrane space protein sorting protein [Schizosaccharomyces octosporus yFS286]